jgi:hypothetical protein
VNPISTVRNPTDDEDDFALNFALRLVILIVVGFVAGVNLPTVLIIARGIGESFVGVASGVNPVTVINGLLGLLTGGLLIIVVQCVVGFVVGALIAVVAGPVLYGVAKRVPRQMRRLRFITAFTVALLSFVAIAALLSVSTWQYDIRVGTATAGGTALVIVGIVAEVFPLLTRRTRIHSTNTTTER